MRTASLCLALLLAAAPLHAQGFTGSWTIAGGAAPITLTLRQAGARVTGTLQGQSSFRIEGRIEDGDFEGMASNASGRLYLAAELDESGNLSLVMAEVGPDGSPQMATARQMVAIRSGARGRDAWAGAFAGPQLSLQLENRGGTYQGVALYQGARYTVQGQVQGNQMSGQYSDGSTVYPFQAQLDGDVMQFAAGGQVFQMQRQAAGGGAPDVAGGRGTAPAGGVAGGGPQDRQLAQLLMRSAWCSFRYVSAGNSSGSGRSSTERIVFQQDGTGARSTGSESSYSGSSGSVYGSSSGGEAFRWRVQNGMLVVTDQNGASESIALVVSQNSNGYPIITANRTEYSMCS